jgi:hypothetical protein
MGLPKRTLRDDRQIIGGRIRRFSARRQPWHWQTLLQILGQCVDGHLFPSHPLQRYLRLEAAHVKSYLRAGFVRRRRHGHHTLDLGPCVGRWNAAIALHGRSMVGAERPGIVPMARRPG